MDNSLRRFVFCDILDGLYLERIRLLSVKAVTNYGGWEYGLHTFLVNRALKQNMKQIHFHDCSICERSFRGTNPWPDAKLHEMAAEELLYVQNRVQALLKREIEEAGLFD